ncbi:Itaconate transport protein [Colletotrichum siamense]|uniref:Itaconate transport protein n=1 Tax=Colletotrichum siamense TaxID=690259 RepID=A0A9P5K2U9_COLSI|nr:Itaconate transport protein [Colletotrichum siamense]KAF4840912.1 Itaconate transport protein [Colletotrichum siamense]KAF4857579.1 Itaconate transport protein [Colletotrichum siamense]KAF5511569.1 Itaconate transport protein [Colletotrichum siamense]
MAKAKDAKNEPGTGPVPEPLRIPLGDAGVAEPYSIFTRKEKWFIVGMVAVAGFYSPLPANIYLPAIPKLSKAFGKSVELLNLTVTAFLAMQGISPMLWGPLSDRYGRRPVFLVCLTVLIGACVGIAVCPTDAFWLLIVLRCLQAAGCASTIALGAGVIGDISTPEERGGFFGMFNLGPMISPCIAPAIGGALSDKLGWRSIFWFLIVMAVCCLLFILLFLPETLRNLVGNGSVTLGGVYTPLVPVVGRSRKKQKTTPSKPGVRPSINPFVILVYPDVAITLAFTGVVYAVNNTVVTTVASSFARVYPWLSETALGLCYLPTGFGMIVGSTLTGKFLDWDYARIKKSVEESDGALEFPKEYARLRTMPVLLVLFSGAVIAWGFCVDKGVHIAVPLALQVVLGYTSISILNTTMTLMIDILQTRSSAATACTNLVRCLLAALLVGLIDRMTAALRVSWSYVLLGGVCALMLPLMYIEMKFGPKWRLTRDLKSIED